MWVCDYDAGTGQAGEPRLFIERLAVGRPDGAAVDSQGNVYVADTGNHYIKKFTSSGVFALKFGGGGSGDGQFGIPFGVAVGSVDSVGRSPISGRRMRSQSST